MDTQTQIERLIELAIVQRSELKQLVSELPQLREYLSAEIERTFEETEPQIRTELEEFCRARATDEHAKTGVALAAKVEELSKQLEVTTAAKYSVLMAERAENANLLAKAEARIEDAASMLSHAVKEIVTDELSRFPRAGEIDQLRKEFAEPRGLNPRGRWMPDETYQRLDLVTINGDSFVSNIDGNRERPSRTAGDWTLSAARGNGGGGGGVTTMTDLVPVPTNGQLLIGNGSAFVNATLTAGTGISISNGPGSITINATDGNITLDDGTAAAPSLNFTNEPTTGLFRASANVMGFAVAGTSRATMTATGMTVAGTITPSGSVHAAAGTVSNPSLAFNSDQNTGLYNIGADNIGVAAGGAKVLDIATTGLGVTGTLSVSGVATLGAGAILNTPASGTLTNATGLPISTGVSGLGANVATFLATPSSANLAAALTDETGTGANVFATSPTLTTPISATLTSPASIDLTLGTGTYGTALTVASATGAVTATTTLADQGGTIAAQRNGLAPRQGLAFDGTSSAGITFANVGAFGTSNFTLAYIFRGPLTGLTYIPGVTGGAAPIGYVDGSGVVTFGHYLDGYKVTTATGAVIANKTAIITIVRSNGTDTIYINGVSVATGADSSNYSVGLAQMCSEVVAGTVVTPLAIYNRALSAAEVLALYQTGAVASADYNTASNTAINTSTIANYAPSPYAVFTGASASGFVASATTYSYAYSAPVFSVIKGVRYRVNITLSSVSGQLPSILLGQLGVVNLSSITALVSGVNTIELTATATNAYAVVIFTNSAVGAFTASSITVTRLGVLLAPDSNNAGAGLEWLDVSGNRAHIILPTSGVTWSLPSSQQIVIEASTSTNGNQQLGGASLIDTNKQWRIQSWTVNCSTGTPTISLGNVSAGTQYVSGAVLAAGNNDITLLARFPSTANLWANSSTTATLIHRITLVPAN